MSTRRLFKQKIKFGATAKEWAEAFFRIFNGLRNKEMETTRCRRCGRLLKNTKSIEHGYGPSCYKKVLQMKKAKPLFEIKEKKSDG